MIRVLPNMLRSPFPHSSHPPDFLVMILDYFIALFYIHPELWIIVDIFALFPLHF